MTITLDEFSRHAGSDFALEQPSATQIRLQQVESRTPPGGDYECFALIFSAPAPVLPQATYKLHHPELGELALFLVPTGQKGDRVEYESLFNRLRDY